MTGAAQRSAKGVDPITREIAERMARQSGLSLDDWLKSLMALDAARDSRGDIAPEARAGPYLEMPRPGEASPGRFEAPEHPADEVARMAQAVERLSQRIEAAENRAGQAIGGVEKTVRGAIHRLDGDEREQVAVAARFEGAVQEIGAEQARIAERLRRIEHEAHGPRSVEALRALEGALGTVAGRLYDGESRTREAIAEVSARVDRLQSQEGASAGMVEAVVSRIGERLEEAESRTGEALRQLQASFAALDARLGSVEGEIAGGTIETRLEQIADNLTARLDAARSEMDARLRTTADGRIDQVERALAQMSDHVRTAERRSAEAIERMGREVVDMAGTLTRRVQSAETRGAQTIEQVGGEVARIAQAVEAKLGRADTVHAQALEKLGAEIARISERLAERIASSDRRAALAIDEVGEQVARTSERFTQRHERVSEDLAERIRLSEERTARVLDEARERLERLAPPRQSEDGAGAAAMAGSDDAGEPIYGDDPFVGFQPPPPSPLAFEAAMPEHDGGLAPAFTQEDLDAADGLSGPAEVAEGHEEPTFGRREDPRFDAASTSGLEAPEATWEVLQRARAEALAASEASASVARPPRVEAAPVEGGGLFSSGFSRPRRRPGAGGVALGVGMAAAVGVAMGGFWVVEGAPKGPLATALAGLIGGGRAPDRAATAGTTAPPAQTAPQEAVALAPAIADAGAGLSRLAAPSPDLALRYAAAVAQIDAKQAPGVDALRRVANLGYAPAQFYLAKLYETGADGLKKDASEARRWTERAAQGGEPKAMHNLALYYFEGTGGPRNTATAAEWFRRAAEQGLVDSQFNLGRLYEQGFGVARNAAEAYKWYAIAGRSGDAESRAGAARLGATLSPEARMAADRFAAGYRGSAGAAPAPPQTPTGDLVSAQKALLALGYYQGPADGAASPALRLALSAYQQDQGLAATGAPDPATMGKLSTLTR